MGNVNPCVERWLLTRCCMYHSHDGINGGETSWTNFLAPWPLLEAAVENFKWFIRTAVYVECVLWLRHPSRTLQGWEKKWALGCVNPASWLPPAAGGEFTQPRAHSFAHLGIHMRYSHIKKWSGSPEKMVTWLPSIHGRSRGKGRNKAGLPYVYSTQLKGED